MAFSIRQVDYFYTTVRDEPGEAYKLLSMLAGLNINLLAFNAIPTGPSRTQLAIFPEDADQLTAQATHANMELDGPHPAILVQGDDELGALAEVHRKLFDASVNVYAASGAADGRGSFGYIIYVKSEDFNRAVAALGI